MTWADLQVKWCIAGRPIPREIDPGAQVIASGAVKTDDAGRCFTGPGVISTPTGLVMVYPSCYGPAIVPDLEHGLLLIRTMRRYLKGRRKAIVTVEEPFSVGGAAGDGFLAQIEAGLALIEDERRNGMPQFAMRQQSNTGRIHWKRTILAHPPVSSGLDDVFSHFVADRVRRDHTHPLTVLYQQVLKHIWGLFGMREPFPLKVNRLQAQTILDRWKQETFSDRGLKIIRLLENFFAGFRASTDPQTHTWMIAKSHHVLWERMLRETLAPTQDNPSLPKGAYYIHSTKYDNGLRLIPDILIHEEDELHIIDAKDYAFNTFPPSADIQKQILYRFFLSSEFNPVSCFNSRQITSSFLMPELFNAASATKCFAKGLHRVPLESDPEGWGKIAVIAVDYWTVSRAYCDRRPLPELRKQVIALILNQSACSEP